MLNKLLWLIRKCCHWRVRSRIFAWGLSAIVVAFLLSSFLAPSYTHCQHAQQAKNAENEKAQPNPIPKRSDITIFWICQGEFIEKNDKVIVALFTVVLALSTIFLWLATTNIVYSTEEASREQFKRTREVERAYFTGGGECQRDSAGPVLNGDCHRQFRFEVGNHGKTPAFMYEYALQFATLDEVCRRHIPYEPRTFFDQFPPGERSRPTDALRPITRSDADVAFGAVWYRDIWGTEHYSRFILGIANNGQTHSNVPGIDSKYYRKWT